MSDATDLFARPGTTGPWRRRDDAPPSRCGCAALARGGPRTGRRAASGQPLRRLVDGSPASGRYPQRHGRTALGDHLGPPGNRKTTLAHLVASASNRRFVQLSAVTARRQGRPRGHGPGSPRARPVRPPDRAVPRRDPPFTKAQQDGLLPGVENRLVVLVAATTENRRSASSRRSSPLGARCPAPPPTRRSARSSTPRSSTSGPGRWLHWRRHAREHLVRIAGGDARRALNALEAAAGGLLDTEPLAGGPLAGDRHRRRPVSIAPDAYGTGRRPAAVRYDRAGDQHQRRGQRAFIKSMRGSDVDAALHYLARMLEAGEDPRFIARRIVIAASEDVGMADPTALQTAVAAMHAVAQIGMPEARIILAQAVVHNALAPKSNAAYLATGDAIADVRAGKGGLVPPHLRGSWHAGAGRPGRRGACVRARRRGRRRRPAVPPRRPGGRTDYYRPTGRGSRNGWSPAWAGSRSVWRTTERKTLPDGGRCETMAPWGGHRHRAGCREACRPPPISTPTLGGGCGTGSLTRRGSHLPWRSWATWPPTPHPCCPGRGTSRA